ncbi:MAG: glycosyltransferase, partial [bacterium]|nr:glycosyltransferase [bacterium]
MNNKKYAPIILFVYARPHHTKKTIEALLDNSEAVNSDLIIFSDGPKSNQEYQVVNEVRSYISLITGFKSITLHFNDSNLGLAESIIHGVTSILKKHEQVIVLEDDIVTSPFFLKYMNEALEKYKNNNNVASIHGYIYPVDISLPETFFLQGA